MDILYFVQIIALRLITYEIFVEKNVNWKISCDERDDQWPVSGDQWPVSSGYQVTTDQVTSVHWLSCNSWHIAHWFCFNYFNRLRAVKNASRQKCCILFVYRVNKLFSVWQFSNWNKECWSCFNKLGFNNWKVKWSGKKNVKVSFRKVVVHKTESQLSK